MNPTTMLDALERIAYLEGVVDTLRAGLDHGRCPCPHGATDPQDERLCNPCKRRVEAKTGNE